MQSIAQFIWIFHNVLSERRLVMLQNNIVGYAAEYEKQYGYVIAKVLYTFAGGFSACLWGMLLFRLNMDINGDIVFQNISVSRIIEIFSRVLLRYYGYVIMYCQNIIWICCNIILLSMQQSMNNYMHM